MLNLYVLNQNVRHLSEFDMTIRLSSSRIDLWISFIRFAVLQLQLSNQSKLSTLLQSGIGLRSTVQ